MTVYIIIIALLAVGFVFQHLHIKYLRYRILVKQKLILEQTKLLESEYMETIDRKRIKRIVAEMRYKSAHEDDTDYSKALIKRHAYKECADILESEMKNDLEDKSKML